MKMKNIIETSLFHKFNSNNDSFISNIYFNTSIDEFLPLFPTLKTHFSKQQV